MPWRFKGRRFKTWRFMGWRFLYGSHIDYQHEHDLLPPGTPLQETFILKKKHLLSIEMYNCKYLLWETFAYAIKQKDPVIWWTSTNRITIICMVSTIHYQALYQRQRYLLYALYIHRRERRGASGKNTFLSTGNI